MERDRIRDNEQFGQESQPGSLSLELLKRGDPIEWRIEAYIQEAEWWSTRKDGHLLAAVGCLQMGAEEVEIVNAASIGHTYDDQHRLADLLHIATDEWQQRGIRRFIAYIGSWELDRLSAYQHAGFRMIAIEPDYYTEFELPPAENNVPPRLDRLMLERLVGGVSRRDTYEIEPTIRRAELRDGRALLAMKKRLDHETTSMLFEPGERRMTDGDQLEQIRTLLRSSNSLLVVAEWDGEIVGYIEATGGKVRRNQHTIYIVVGIHEACTGQGLGRRLFDVMFEWATRRQVLRAELTVQASNQRAYRLYRSLGFRLEGVMRGALIVEGESVDLYQMGCDLRSIQKGRVDK